MSRSPIGVLVLNRDGAEWLPPLYRSLSAQDYPVVRVYLVDNASTDDSVESTARDYPDVTVVRMSRNEGYCTAYNQATRRAFEDGCDWVVWANNDILVEPDCLSGLVHAVVADTRIGVAGPCFLGWDNDEPNAYMVENHPRGVEAMVSGTREPLDVEWVEGSFLMVSRACYEQVGGLDPYYFLYWEEADFCRRARYQGWRVVLVPCALARHYAGGYSRTDKSHVCRLLRKQMRNQFVYTLCDPFRGFAANMLSIVHLLIVKLRSGRRSGDQTRWTPLWVFCDVMSDVRILYKKWRRDQRGDPPVRAGLEKV